MIWIVQIPVRIFEDLPVLLTELLLCLAIVSTIKVTTGCANTDFWHVERVLKSLLDDLGNEVGRRRLREA